MLKTVAVLACSIAAIPLIYLGYIAVGVLQMGYGWQEMDWNADGSTSVGEFLSSTDIGKRELMRGSRKCWEYYAVKDGMPIRTDCPAE